MNEGKRQKKEKKKTIKIHPKLNNPRSKNCKKNKKIWKKREREGERDNLRRMREEETWGERGEGVRWSSGSAPVGSPDHDRGFGCPKQKPKAAFVSFGYVLFCPLKTNPSSDTNTRYQLAILIWF